MDEFEREPLPEGSFDPLKVTLPYFDGPLDLLLHLVRQHKLDIAEVKLADLTEPYLAYVEKITELNLDQAGEFLTIAATLVWLKSRSLLPPDETEDEELDPDTVEELLLKRLQDYQRIKEAADQLHGRDLLGRDVFGRGGDPEEEGGAPPSSAQDLFQEVSLFALLEAFREVLERTEDAPVLTVMPERDRVEDRINEMVALLATRRELYFTELFLPDATRSEIILSFLSLLELVRLKVLRLGQIGHSGPILCRVTDDFDATGDWKDRLMQSLLEEDAPKPTAADANSAAPAESESPTLAEAQASLDDVAPPERLN
jgi:segregation and condensation protein A